MNLELNQDGLCLQRKQVLRVRGGRGRSIVCHSGSVWVTQEGDARDVILLAGESFTLDRAGLALVLAFEPSAVSVAQTQSRTATLAAFLKAALPGAGSARGAVGV